MACSGSLLLVLAAVLLLCTGGTEDEESLPRFKWGQSKQKIFITIAVRDLDRDSVRIEFSEDRLKFSSLDSWGKVYTLDMELVQDVIPDACRWEQLARKDRWGEAVLATLTKTFPAAWATLALDQSRFKQVMDRDWSREEESLENPEEDAFFEEHAEYLPRVSETTLERELKGVEAVVLLARHAACEQCSVADKTFAAVAKEVSESVKTPRAWQSRLRLRVVDLRTSRELSRSLGARCAKELGECRYHVIASSGGREPVQIRGRHDEAHLRKDLERLSQPQFQKVTAVEARAGSSSSRSLVVLAPKAPEHVRQAAHQMRLRLTVAVAKDDADAQELGLVGDTMVVAWRAGEATARVFDGEPEALERWLRCIATPLLADVKEFVEDEPYKELGLPLAKLFLTDGALDTSAREVVGKLSSAFFGRLAFQVRNASWGASDWRQHGLPAGQFPGFAVARSAAFNASKFAFLKMPSEQTEEFWAGPASQLLSDFLEDVLAARLEESRMSEAPSEDPEAGSGAVKKLVGRQCRRLVEESPTEALIEGFDEWRRDHKRRSLQLDLLTPLLTPLNITVYRLDLGYNECPPDVLPSIAAGYSGYFFVHANARKNGRKLQRLKKLDPDFEKVLSFLQKHSAAKPDAKKLFTELEQALAAKERKEVLATWASDWRAALAAGIVGAVGILAFRLLRTRAAATSTAVRGDKKEAKSE